MLTTTLLRRRPNARALVLDLLAQQEIAGRLDIDHDAFDLDPAEFGRAWDALRNDGLANGVEGEALYLTDAGREARRAAERTPAPLPSLTSALARRAQLFGAHAG